VIGSSCSLPALASPSFWSSHRAGIARTSGISMHSAGFWSASRKPIRCLKTLMNSSRVEAFSDGVFSIAATLLVLQLHVPTPAEGDFGRALLSQWPTYASYAVSFTTIGVIWVNHHTLFSQVRKVDRPLLLMNLLLLLSVSTIPFPTALLGRYIGEGEPSHLAAAVYGGVMLTMS